MPFLTKAWGWITNNPVAQILIAVFFALIGWEVVKRNIQETGRIKERERIAAAQAEARLAGANRQREVQQEESRNADQALEARDNGPLYPTSDSVPDALQGVTFRHSGSGGGGQ
mgnify:CR=1 FL=1